MREQGFTLQGIPLGRDNIITVAKPKPENIQRHPMAIATEVPQFVHNFAKLGEILKHCKKALMAMEHPSGTLQPFPEDEFVLSYGQPSLWKNWHEFAKFAKYKIQSEGFLNSEKHCWSIYALKLRAWALHQGFLPLEDPALHQTVPGQPTPRQHSDPHLPYNFVADLDPRFHPYPSRGDEIDPNRRSIDSGKAKCSITRIGYTHFLSIVHSQFFRPPII